MPKMAKLHRYRLKSTALKKTPANAVLCITVYTPKPQQPCNYLPNNFCFSVKLSLGVAACDTSYILGKR